MVRGKLIVSVVVDDDIVVHPGIQESVCFFIAVDDDIVVHPGIQDNFIFVVDDDIVVVILASRKVRYERGFQK